MHPRSLVPGNCYFYVNYCDDKLTVPGVQTLIYQCCETSDDGERHWLFEEPGYETPLLVRFADKQLYGILGFEQLIDKLSECAMDHPVTPPQSRQTPLGINEHEAERLRNNIQDFLENDDWYSVTVTIFYTDDGLSLGRTDDTGLKMSFFTNPRLDPSEEKRIFDLFAEIGTEPHVDYLSQGGRKRVLDFAISDSPVEIFDLCVRVLTEVHRIRGDYELKFSFHPIQSTRG